MQAAELFDDETMAAGYARDRPPVHRYLMERVRATPGWADRVGCALDLGCGAGASTAALAELASRRIGIDPYAPMVCAARRAVRGARFAVGAAEALPVATESVDLIAAAGSLNFVDLGAFLVEADRVLAAEGRIAVTNFSFGAPADTTLAPRWPERFVERWPRPPASPVTASSFAASPFEVTVAEDFVVSVPMNRDAYLAYVMTETNVAQAVAGGESIGQIRDWCAAELRGWTAPRPVEFRASILLLGRSVSRT